MKITSTQIYRRWFSKLRDETTKARINLRITRLAEGNAGNHRNLTHGISELKLTFGAGYRVYYTQRNDELILLLIGGDKSSQSEDIKAAIEMVNLLDSEE
jgi:putative addiction module killer protein